MKVVLGEDGVTETFQAEFPKITSCCWCKGEARIGFVAREEGGEERVYQLHENLGKGSYWLHDSCAVAIYFCKECLKPTAEYNQA